jgi:hypothetical protein
LVSHGSVELAAEDGVLVSEDEEFRVLAGVLAEEQCGD